MKIIVIGATGTIGAAVVTALSQKHSVIAMTRKSEGVRIDIEDPASVRAAFDSIKDFDAVVSCAGNAAWKPLADLSDEDFAFSLKSKLMGQVNVVRAAIAKVKDGGSITLTSGVLAQTPMAGAAAVSLVNAGLEGFVRVAALEAKRGVRVNIVSPPWVKETMVKMGMDPEPGTSAADVARAYVEVVEGTLNGHVINAAIVKTKI